MIPHPTMSSAVRSNRRPRHPFFTFYPVVILFIVTGIAQSFAQENKLDQAFTDYWSADSPVAASLAIEGILNASNNFNEIQQRLALGQPYPNDSATGKIRLSRLNINGTEHPFFILVPEDYNPQQQYPVRVYLHGGVSRSAWGRRSTSWWRQTEGMVNENSIAIFPAAWNRSPWWQESQIENLAGIIDWTKRNYNIDENQVHLFGVSDGASGVYYQAMRAPTPWASILPFIGHAGVMAVKERADGGFHVHNLSNRPFFIINGSEDRLYPVAAVQPWIDLFESEDVELVFTPKIGFGHETTWWPDEAENIERFIAAHPRDPLPARISWQTEQTDKQERFHWLQILELGTTPGDVLFINPTLNLGSPKGFYGRVDLLAEGNKIQVYSQGVKQYKLLISEQQFDLSLPIQVYNNDTLVYEQTVTADVNTLLKWAARDNDRSMLFAAEIEISLSE